MHNKIRKIVIADCMPFTNEDGKLTGVLLPMNLVVGAEHTILLPLNLVVGAEHTILLRDEKTKERREICQIEVCE